MFPLVVKKRRGLGYYIILLFPKTIFKRLYRLFPLAIAKGKYSDCREIHLPVFVACDAAVRAETLFSRVLETPTRPSNSSHNNNFSTSPPPTRLRHHPHLPLVKYAPHSRTSADQHSALRHLRKTSTMEFITMATTTTKEPTTQDLATGEPATKSTTTKKPYRRLLSLKKLNPATKHL